jgi:hypothetical protein
MVQVFGYPVFEWSLYLEIPLRCGSYKMNLKKYIITGALFVGGGAEVR